jgi:hypothetical protein
MNSASSVASSGVTSAGAGLGALLPRGVAAGGIAALRRMGRERHSRSTARLVSACDGIGCYGLGVCWGSYIVEWLYGWSYGDGGAMCRWASLIAVSGGDIIRNIASRLAAVPHTDASRQRDSIRGGKLKFAFFFFLFPGPSDSPTPKKQQLRILDGRKRSLSPRNPDWILGMYNATDLRSTPTKHAFTPPARSPSG